MKHTNIIKAIRIIKKYSKGAYVNFITAKNTENEVVYISNGHLLLTLPIWIYEDIREGLNLPTVEALEADKMFTKLLTDTQTKDRRVADITTICVDINRDNKTFARVFSTTDNEYNPAFIMIAAHYYELFRLLNIVDITADPEKPQKAELYGEHNTIDKLSLLVLPINQGKPIEDVINDIFPQTVIFKAAV